MAFNWIGKSADGNTITLKRLDESLFRFPKYFTMDWATQNREIIRTGAVLDVETTGLAHEQDHVIELGIRTFRFNRNTGDILGLHSSYHGYQDPGQPLSEEIISLTGITDEMLKDKKIDWTQVDELLKTSQVIIAHNASFDRPFMDRSSPVSSEKIWACSYKQINWAKKGFSSPKLDLLNIYHGFFTDSHRALNDADALLYLLSLTDELTKTPYLFELLQNARKVSVQVMASNSPFESKDHLKARHYRWDGQNRYWAKNIQKEELLEELAWLEAHVYSGKFKGKYLEIQPQDAFKSQTPA